MTSTDQSSRVIAYAVEVWGRTHGGISGLDIAKHLSISHDDVLRILEELNANGHGNLNRNVELYQVRIDLENPSEKMEGERVTTHIYFPCKEILHRAFFASDLPSKNVPEYKKRLHLGASQIGLVFFTEEVLTRYLDHPELYVIHDSLAGGDLSSLSESPEDRQLYVRYGKSRLKSGKTALTAIVHDLSVMSASEQRYWHSHEIEQPSIDRTDENFKRFLARTYDGEFVDFPDPISEVVEAMRTVNEALVPAVLFTRTENIHLRLPVEQTYKALCDSASELYKLVGPDGISKSTLQKHLASRYGLEDEAFIHKESGRPLSTMQLIGLLESLTSLSNSYAKAVKKVGDLRIDADHKILTKEAGKENYSDVFAALCSEVRAGLTSLAASTKK
jgi:hypothetical protein